MPIPSFRHLEDESLLLDERIEEEAGRFLGVVKGVYREIGPGSKSPSTKRWRRR